MPVSEVAIGKLRTLPAEATQLLATTFNLSRAEVHGVITFYDFFRTEPPGLRIVRICQAEACQSMGSEALAAHAKAVRAPNGTGDLLNVALTMSAGGVVEYAKRPTTLMEYSGEPVNVHSMLAESLSRIA